MDAAISFYRRAYHCGRLSMMVWIGGACSENAALKVDSGHHARKVKQRTSHAGASAGDRANQFHVGPRKQAGYAQAARPLPATPNHQATTTNRGSNQQACPSTFIINLVIPLFLPLPTNSLTSFFVSVVLYSILQSIYSYSVHLLILIIPTTVLSYSPSHPSSRRTNND